MRWFAIVALVLLIPSLVFAVQLQDRTIVAFNKYARATEQQMTKDMNSGFFLYIDGLPPEQRDAAYARLRRGEILLLQPPARKDGGPIDVPSGLIHHWIGVVFIPRASLRSVIDFLQDYDDQYKYFAPDIKGSRLISRSGQDFHVYLRLHRKKVVTVTLNTEYDVHYSLLGNDRARAWSRSTRIAEVEHAGEPGESEKPPGNDDGFLWRLNSYWSFREGEGGEGGTYVQLEAISLTRDIPAGLGWLVRPFVTSVPRESLQFTLGRTRSALCHVR